MTKTSVENPVMLYKEAEIAHDVHEEISKNAWEHLREAAMTKGSVEKLRQYLEKCEIAYMEHMYGDVPEAKKKNGRWKFARFEYMNEDGEKTVGGLPMAYRTAKSVLVKALENDMPITESTSKHSADVFIRENKNPAAQITNHITSIKRLKKKVSKVEWELIWDVYIAELEDY